jgi:hypothetical protein
MFDGLWDGNWSQTQGEEHMTHPSYCCPKCGELIGWLGRIMPFHKCKEKNNELLWLQLRSRTKLSCTTDQSNTRKLFSCSTEKKLAWSTFWLVYTCGCLPP